MKKLIASLITLIMIAGICACGNSETVNTSEKSLYDQGFEVVTLMAELTRTSEYVEVYTGSGEIQEIVKGIGEGDFSKPKAVYAITASEEELLSFSELGNLEGASEELKASLKSRVFGSLMTQINGFAGVNNLAAASVCTVGKTFVNTEVTDDVVYLYTFDNATPVAVTFTVGEDGAVSAGGNFVMYEEFTCGSADEIKAFFSDFIVEVKEVEK